MSDLSGKPADPLPPVADRKLLEIDVDNFDDRMKAMKPRVAFMVPNTLTGEGNVAVDITFESMDDFSPAAVARKVDALNKLLEARTQLSNLLTYMDGKTGAEDLITKVLQRSRPAADPGARRRSPADGSQRPGSNNAMSGTQANAGAPARRRNRGGQRFRLLLNKEFKPKTDRAREAVEAAVQTLAAAGAGHTALVSDDALRTSRRSSRRSTRKLTEQINLIIHNEDFQQLESAWRGLHYLVNNTETDEMLKIRVLNISKKELGRTLKKFRGTAWDQSPIFKKIYEEEYGQFGGEPYGVLVGDYYFDHGPQDMQLLGDIAQIAAAAHAPFIAAAAPTVMQMDSWEELANPRDLTKIFQTPEYAAWRSLRESEDSRYHRAVHAALPGAPAVRREDRAGRGIPFRGRHRRRRSSKFCWANSAYAMATNITRAFKLYGWTTRIRGIESGGAVEGLPAHTFPTDDGGVAMKCPTEIAISDRREAELAKNGFMPLIHKKNSDFAAFIGAQSLQKPQEYDDPGGDGERQPLGAAALSVRELPVRALPEMHGARQDRRHHDQEPVADLADRAGSANTSMARQIHRPTMQGNPSAGRGHGRWSKKTRRILATTAPSSTSSRTTSSKGLTVSLRLVSRMPK